MQQGSSVRMGAKRLARRRSISLAVLAVGLIAALGNATNAFALSPSVSTLAAANVADTTATLNGSVNPNSLETKTYFEYGPTTSYGSKTTEVNVGSGSSTLETAKAITGLTANTTYHYRIVASNSSGTSQGADRTFTVGWVVQATASPKASTYFTGVSCSSATACTAVGGALAQRWNGSEWKAQTLPEPVGATGISLSGVTCPSASACTAVGYYMHGSGELGTLVEFWNGTEWKVQSSPNPSGISQLEGVSCTSSSECTAVGQYRVSVEPEVWKTLAMRWNGTEWKTQTTPNPSSNFPVLESVSCSSSTSCMAVGFYRDSSSMVYTPLAELWNGSEWTIKTAAKPAGERYSWLYGVSCTSSTACTAVGEEEANALEHETKTMAERWNGSEWKLQTMPNTEYAYLEDVSCTSSTACTAIGYAGEKNPLEMRWDGSTWTLFAAAIPSGANLTRPFAVSCVAGRGCEAVGEYRNSSSEILPLAEGRWRSAPPTTTTTAATSIGEKSATINGTVNPNGSESKASFEYGTTTSYGSKTAEVNVGAGTSPIERSETLSGLSPNTTYHYRLVANNENPETGKGEDKTFTTIGPPTVTTEAGVSEASGETATLNGVVNPNGQSTTYQFEYGTTSGVYTKTVPEPAESAGSGTSGKAVSYTITGLTRGTKYYFRVTATNAGGKVNGSEHSFLTDSAPAATTLEATSITLHGATLNGTVAPHGLATKYQFEYGTTTSYGTKVPVSPAELKSQSESGSEFVEQPVAGLATETVYHYRLVAENALGTSTGEDKTFTTKEESGPKTVLCTEKVSTCPLGKTDGTGTEIAASLVSGAKFKITNTFKTIECSKSSISAKVASTGEKITATVETLTFGECNCTFTVLKKGQLIFSHIAATDNGTLTSNGAEITGSCSTIFGTVHCIYVTESTDMGTLEGGNPAKIKSSAANIPRLTTHALCAEEASWDAEYEVTSPKPLYIET